MTVTPEQIEGAAFSTVKRGGYRTEEVDRFLRTLADEHRNLLKRLRAAEGSNEDLEAASAEMAALMRDVHAQLGEKRRLAESEALEIRATAEREAASIISGATEQADGIRQQADRVLSDAEHHAELLRSDGEQRVREQAAETLRLARGELQSLLRKKHELMHSIKSLRTDLADIEAGLEASSLSPDALDDSIINQTLIDLRAAEERARAAESPTDERATARADVFDDDDFDDIDDPAAPHPADAAASHPATTTTTSTFFSPPDADS